MHHTGTPHPFNQKEYWKDPLLRNAIIGPIDDGIPRRDGAFRDDWQPQRNSESSNVSNSSDPGIEQNGMSPPSTAPIIGPLVQSESCSRISYPSTSQSTSLERRSKELLAPTQSFLTGHPSSLVRSSLVGESFPDGTSLFDRTSSASRWNWWGQPNPPSALSGSRLNRIHTPNQQEQSNESWLTSPRRWLRWTPPAAPPSSNSNLNYKVTYNSPKSPGHTSQNYTCTDHHNMSDNRMARLAIFSSNGSEPLPVIPLRKCPPEIASHYSDSSTSLVRKYHLLSLLLTLVIYTLGIGILVSFLSSSNLSMLPILSLSNISSSSSNISFLNSRDIDISTSEQISPVSPSLTSPPLLLQESSILRTRIDQTYQIVMLVVFIFIYWVEVFTSSTRRLLSLLTTCPTINDVVCRVTTATPVITFGISCWHLARQDTECASNATETSRRCLQQHRVDAFTQTEAFHFEYCRDASESLSLVPSADDPNSRRRNVRYNRYPTQTSTEPKNGAVGAVILDIQLSYHLLELDTVERVNDLRERLRLSCRHRDDYFDEQQWVTLPGLPQDGTSGNSQSLHIPPLICRAGVQRKTDNFCSNLFQCGRESIRRFFGHPRTPPENQTFLSSSDNIQHHSSPDWLTLSSYLLMSLLLLSWPYRIVVDSYVRRETWKVRKVVSVHGDLDSSTEDDEIEYSDSGGNPTVTTLRDNSSNPFANEDQVHQDLTSIS